MRAASAARAIASRASTPDQVASLAADGGIQDAIAHPRQIDGGKHRVRRPRRAAAGSRLDPGSGGHGDNRIFIFSAWVVRLAPNSRFFARAGRGRAYFPWSDLHRRLWKRFSPWPPERPPCFPVQGPGQLAGAGHPQACGLEGHQPAPPAPKLTRISPSRCSGAGRRLWGCDRDHLRAARRPVPPAPVLAPLEPPTDTVLLTSYPKEEIPSLRCPIVLHPEAVRTEGRQPCRSSSTSAR